jgi:hypothetical protein
MQLRLEADKQTYHPDEDVVVRLLAVNDTYEAVILDRTLLVGPNPAPEGMTVLPFPVSVEPAFAEERYNQVILSPWCIYGRERNFGSLPAGRVMIYGYLLEQMTPALSAQGPGEKGKVTATAEPLVITIESSAEERAPTE